MNNTRDHQKLVDELLFAFGSRPDVRVWPRVVGVGRALKSNDVIRYGLKGESDIDGIIAPHGRKLCIEVKTGRGQLSKDQQVYRDVMTKFGALYIEARLDPDRDFVKAVSRCLDFFEKNS